MVFLCLWLFSIFCQVLGRNINQFNCLKPSHGLIDWYFGPEVDLINKKINVFSLGGPPIGYAQSEHLVNYGILNYHMRCHGNLAQREL